MHTPEQLRKILRRAKALAKEPHRPSVGRHDPGFHRPLYLGNAMTRKCAECDGAGRITLLTSVVECNACDDKAGQWHM